ncbi:MAG: flagellar M-ring protein FliF [Betaproteobacteria bacterium]|nr:flagellar M-ring protein FliF [Betaproteobacteria bacterium]
MESAEQTAPLPVPATTPLALAWSRFNDMPQKQRLGMMFAAAVAVAMVVAAVLWSRTPEYSVLFSNLSERDGGAIVTALTQQNVPYRFSEGGGAILVPADVVHDVRLRLASQGLPKGGLVGFELMETQKLGISQFLEQVNYQRALEGELSRSIQALNSVAGARVHLAIPRQTAFLRDEQKPSASVLVNLHPGRSLEPSQVAGIVHLVSSSVPHMPASGVDVIDQNGNLLSKGGDPMRAAGLDANQLKYVRELESSYIKRIEDILSPITGAGNIRAQVTADVDFSQAEQTAETYRPNQTPNQPSVRSQQSSESLSSQQGPAGVPGALTNQPPAPATAPVTSPPAPGTPGATAGGAAGTPITSRKDATVNYELDKTVQHLRKPVGSVKRLSVAVVVNHRKTTLPDGREVSKPLAEAEMKQIQDLVREAMGFNQERGDTVNVANSPFTATRETVEEVPLWKDPGAIALGKEIGRYLLLAGLAAWAWFGILRPMVRRLTEPETPPEAEEGNAALEGELEGQDALTGPDGPLSLEHKLQQARDLARQDPKLIANVIKDWVGANE